MKINVNINFIMLQMEKQNVNLFFLDLQHLIFYHLQILFHKYEKILIEI